MSADDAYSLFTSPAYLEPLERSGCADADAGWRARHIRLDGAGWAPCYAKGNSWGEFVFDFQIANAYQRNGLRYYPKLVCCVPFTPVPGPRLLAPDDAGKRALADALVRSAQDGGHSGAHILFLPQSEARLLDEAWLRRAQPRYVWRNASGARDFEQFLEALPGKQRKNIRRERRAVAASGLDIRWQTAGETSAQEWPQLYELYSNTYQMRGQDPYLTLECLQAWAKNLGEKMLFCIAREHGEPVAMAFFFRERGSLYGRHWGASARHDGLHFELCYYQGLERCLREGLGHFDAGVQGEHKQTRGFAPELAHSAHWFADLRFRAAIAEFFEAERRELERWLAPSAED